MWPRDAPPNHAQLGSVLLGLCLEDVAHALSGVPPGGGGVVDILELQDVLRLLLIPLGAAASVVEEARIASGERESKASNCAAMPQAAPSSVQSEIEWPPWRRRSSPQHSPRVSHSIEYKRTHRVYEATTPLTYNLVGAEADDILG